MHPTNDRLLEHAPEVRAHLAQCDACRARRAALEKLAAGLEGLGEPLRKDPALVRRILRALPSHRPVWPWVAGIAAAALLAILLLAVPSTETPPRPEVVSTPPTVVPPPPGLPPPEPLPDLPDPPKAEPKTIERPPAPPEPKLETPAPVPAPRPVPAPPPTPPRETRPEKPLPTLVLTAVEGVAGIQPGPWPDGTVLRAGDKGGAIALAGVRLTLRPRAELRAEVPAVRLDRGELFCDVVPGTPFAIVTADARIDVAGTQFSVERSDRTEVVVVGGEVKVSNEKGAAVVPAGTGTTARRGAVPSRARAVNVDALTAWRRGPETSRFRYDFEDGRRPLPWTGGKVTAAAARGLNRFALQGPTIDADLSRVDRRVTAVAPNLVVRFRYYADGGSQIWFQFFGEQGRDNYFHDVRPLARGTWETVEIPLSDLRRRSDDARLQEGDRLTWLNMGVADPVGHIYFDDIELVEVRK